MTSARNLGPILAIAGAALIGIAVIAGFIITGGPGDARDRRLDMMTTSRLNDAFNVIQCAYNGTGAAPATFEAAMNTQGRIAKNEPLQPCNFGIDPSAMPVHTGRTPPNPGAISYEATGPDSVALCANFRRPYEAEICNGICPKRTGEIFYRDRPAGVHCFDLTLTESETGFR